MKLFKRKNSPFWWYDFTVNGRRYRDSTKRPFSDKVGANRVLMAEYDKALNIEQLGDKPEITLREAFDVTLAETEGQTNRVYASSANSILKVLDGDMYCSNLRTHHVERLVMERQKQGLKPNSIRSDLKCLKRATARVRGSYRVSSDVEWPTIKGFVKTRYLTQSEEDIILLTLRKQDTITAEKAHDLCIFLLDTGLRLMEAVNLEWTAIDMTSRQIEVYRTKTRTVSTVPITERVYNLLRRRGNQEMPFEKMEFAIQLLRKTISSVCNKDKRMVTQRGGATIHSLRDTFASRLVQKGLSLHKLSKLLGHTNTAMTAKYAHLETQDVVDEARLLLNAS